ncbi:hypothetical protein B566_EDAN007570 [Ephemera danica]|nr:hypothetical protein B566_EDAN007570 [Ephemera danica]
MSAGGWQLPSTLRGHVGPGSPNRSDKDGSGVRRRNPAIVEHSATPRLVSSDVWRAQAISEALTRVSQVERSFSSCCFTAASSACRATSFCPAPRLISNENEKQRQYTKAGEWHGFEREGTRDSREQTENSALAALVSLATERESCSVSHLTEQNGTNSRHVVQVLVLVWFYWLGCYGAPTPGREPTTAQHGGFWLLGFPPGPVHPSLANLRTRDSSQVPMLMPGLVRTPSQHGPLRTRTPSLKPSSEPSFQVAGLQGHATTPSDS